MSNEIKIDGDRVELLARLLFELTKQGLVFGVHLTGGDFPVWIITLSGGY